MCVNKLGIVFRLEITHVKAMFKKTSIFINKTSFFCILDLPASLLPGASSEMKKLFPKRNLGLHLGRQLQQQQEREEDGQDDGRCGHTLDRIITAKEDVSLAPPTK